MAVASSSIGAGLSGELTPHTPSPSVVLVTCLSQHFGSSHLDDSDWPSIALKAIDAYHTIIEQLQTKTRSVEALMGHRSTSEIVGTESKETKEVVEVPVSDTVPPSAIPEFYFAAAIAHMRQNEWTRKKLNDLKQGIKMFLASRSSIMTSIDHYGIVTLFEDCGEAILDCLIEYYLKFKASEEPLGGGLSISSRSRRSSTMAGTIRHTSEIVNTRKSTMLFQLLHRDVTLGKSSVDITTWPLLVYTARLLADRMFSTMPVDKRIQVIVRACDLYLDSICRENPMCALAMKRTFVVRHINILIIAMYYPVVRTDESSEPEWIVNLRSKMVPRTSQIARTAKATTSATSDQKATPTPKKSSCCVIV